MLSNMTLVRESTPKSSNLKIWKKERFKEANAPIEKVEKVDSGKKKKIN